MAALTMVVLLLLAWVGTVWALADAARRRGRGSDTAGTWVVFLAVSLVTPLAGLVGGGYATFVRPKLKAMELRREVRRTDRIPGYVYGGAWLVGMGILFALTYDAPPPTDQPSHADRMAAGRDQVARCLGNAVEVGEADYSLSGLSEKDARTTVEASGFRFRVIGRDDECRPELVRAEDGGQRRINVYVVDDMVVWARAF